MKIKKSRSQNPWTIMLMVVGALVWVLSCGNVATAFDFHADSAHGNESYGVNRLDAGYDIGDCAHCHDTFDDSTCGVNQHLLFASEIENQKSGLCMDCHSDPTLSYQLSMPYQYDYSRERGGENTKTCPDDIQHAFGFINFSTRLPQWCCGSSVGSAHDLANIGLHVLRNRWGWGSDPYTINPCLGCHDPHRATREYPCSLPSGHADKSTWEVWGDEAGEKMADYVGAHTYQPPYKYPASSEVTEWVDANEAPDYVTLCQECHQSALTSHQHGTVIAIAWENHSWNTKHGKGDAGGTTYQSPTQKGWLKAPYIESNRGQYVLCCTDCHEPHGSRNQWLLRTEVNGVSGIEINSNGDWLNFCSACHAGLEHSASSCHGCHGHTTGYKF